MILVKLGGSVITDKSSYRTYDHETSKRLAEEIVASGQRAIIVHGAGSFGHILAKQYRLDGGIDDPSQLIGVAKVMKDVRDLDQMMIATMIDAGMNVVSVPPSCTARMKDGELLELDHQLFADYLDMGMTPVAFGDVVLDDMLGVSICSGDQLMISLARHFHPSKVIFVADVDGVFTADPNQSPEAGLIERLDRGVLDALPRTERSVDVTGSIYAKIDFMLRMAGYTDECLVLNGKVPGRLRDSMEGRKVVSSTVIGDVQ